MRTALVWYEARTRDLNLGQDRNGERRSSPQGTGAKLGQTIAVRAEAALTPLGVECLPHNEKYIFEIFLYRLFELTILKVAMLFFGD